MKQAELVFIPATAFSHIVAAVETAKLLLERSDRLAITLLIMNPTKDITLETYTYKISSSNPRLRLITLLAPPNPPPTLSLAFICNYIESQVARVLAIVSHLIKQKPTFRLAGLVLDLFTTNFIAVADELGLPSYVFSACGACFLGLSRHLTSPGSVGYQGLKSPTDELSTRYFCVPIPAAFLPGWNLEDEDPTAKFTFRSLKRLSEVEGIVVNTFYDLEPHTIDELVNESDCKSPKIYTVGPILNFSSSITEEDDDVRRWLDEQEENSVVFLCFGSLGGLDDLQVREMALALENCGCRFLWSLRNLQGLPEGFVERNKRVGKVIGWAAQAAILSHTAVGMFVSHCGWNSILESIWYGVPIAAFPMCAEQHLNAFYLVKEIGVAEAITLDYHVDLTCKKATQTVGWEEIAAVLRRLVAEEGRGLREKVKEMQKKAREAFVEGGSSHDAQGLFIAEVMRNIA